jgi:antitoxin YefM
MAYLLPGRLWRQEQVEQVIAGIRQKNIVLDTVLVTVHDTVHMTAMTYTAARENLASTMDRVCVDHDPVIITRNRDQAVVMLSLDDYESLQETAYLLRTPANAKRLISSIESLNSGKTLKKNVKDLAEA